MKIIQVCPYDIDRAGGVQHHMRSLAQEMRNRGHEVIIVAPGDQPTKPSPGVIYCGKRRPAGWNGTQFEISYLGARARPDLLKRLSDWGADLFHFHTIWVPIMPMQLFLRRTAPAVATFHETLPESWSGKVWRWQYGHWSRWLLDRLDGAIAVSDGPKRYLRPGPNGVSPVTLPPSVDLSRFTAVPDKQTGARRAGFRVLYIGRLEQRKGIDILLDAWERVLAADNAATRRRDLQLTLAGYGDLKPAVLEAQARLGADRVAFVEAPTPDQIVRLLADADLAVAPSPYGESFGIVLLEALASGTPVLAADNIGYATVMSGEGAECLVPAGDSTALAAAILRMAANPDRMAGLSAWGRRHAGQFDIREVAARFEAVYEAAVARHAMRNRLGRGVSSRHA